MIGFNAWGGRVAQQQFTPRNSACYMGGQPWLIGDWLRDLRKRCKAGQDQLTRGLELELVVLVAVYEATYTPEWDRVVRRITQAKSIFAVEFQTERSVAQTFVNQMQYLRRNVYLLDIAGGNFEVADEVFVVPRSFGRF